MIPPEPHSRMPPPGTLIRMTTDGRPYYGKGDMAVTQAYGWANFNGLGNPSVCDGGVWCVCSGHFLIVKEAPQ